MTVSDEEAQAPDMLASFAARFRRLLLVNGDAWTLICRCGTMLIARDELAACLSCGKTWFRPQLVAEVNKLTDRIELLEWERDELARFVMQDEQRSAEWIAKGPIPGQVIVYALGNTRREAVEQVIGENLTLAARESDSAVAWLAQAIVDTVARLRGIP